LFVEIALSSREKEHRRTEPQALVEGVSRTLVEFRKTKRGKRLPSAGWRL